MGEWIVSAPQLAKLMGSDATEFDAQDMADLLTSKGYMTRLVSEHLAAGAGSPVSEAVWEECLMTLVALRGR